MENKIKFPKTKILFVCTQNVFRSMSAHYLALKYLKDNNITDFELDSCGTVAYDWESPYQHTLIHLKKKGIDVNGHKNKKINKKLVNESRFIICMTNDHKRYVVQNFNVEPYLFNELALGVKSDLEDDTEANFSCSLNQFIEKTVNHIDSNMEKLIKECIRLVKEEKNSF